MSNSGSSRARKLNLEVADLPLTEIAAFVKSLAKAYGVEVQRSRLNDFAEAVSRLSGDDEPLDDTGKLLVELRKNLIIDGRQLARLMSNHFRET